MDDANILARLRERPELAIEAWATLAVATPWNVGTQVAERRCARTGASVARVGPEAIGGTTFALAGFWWRVGGGEVADRLVQAGVAVDRVQAWSSVLRGKEPDMRRAMAVADAALVAAGWLVSP